ncbi:MAG TPA: hypothetical protein VF633_06400, partial [Brevundimonas sp.]
MGLSAITLDNDDQEHSVPESLHPVFHKVIGAFMDGDFRLLEHEIEGVGRIDAEIAKAIAENILAYGDRLAFLDTSVWERSCYRWMGGYWQLLIDLSTE